MKTFVLIVLSAIAAAALPAGAQGLTERDRQLLQEAQAEQARRAQEDLQRRAERARQNCLANRGVDCDSPQGLEEWVALERSRAEAVLDRVYPPPLSSQPEPSSSQGR